MKVNISLFLIVIFTLGSCYDPKEEYAKKIKIGVCHESEGMVTFEASLYSDSTFYQAGDPLVDFSYGTFRLTATGIFFETLGGEQNFCPEYKQGERVGSYISTGSCHSDPINVYWENSN